MPPINCKRLFGHPTSCASAAEIMAVLFYSVMRYDPCDPHNRDSDVFVLSKAHAAPILYAAWAEAGAFARDKLLTLRKIDSDLEGHPTSRLPLGATLEETPRLIMLMKPTRTRLPTRHSLSM